MYNAAIIDNIVDVLKWWKEHEHKYPILSKIARDYLCIPASSACVESIFSIAGNIVHPNRNRLEPKSIRYLITLKSWMNNN